LLLARRDKGAAIILISEDLDELLALSDRIEVIYEGRIVGSFSSEAADVHEIGLLMTGGEGAHHLDDIRRPVAATPDQSSE
jgi:simple sugar transport system ATP-binding protein